jgi:glyoxylase-like metal-dependent hydrolase (beta-lactamase superfamily II)
MICKILSVGPFQSNCIILACKKTKEGVVIDPGDEPENIIQVIKTNKLRIGHILITHGHLDHVNAVSAIKNYTNGIIALHKEDEPIYKTLEQQAEKFGLYATNPPPVDMFLNHNTQIRFGDYVIETIHTPGHSPGGVCFKILKGDSVILFCGDTLFAGSIGRTDLWQGSFETLIDSIKTKLLIFPDDTEVYPGHGPKTTIGDERHNNPFLQ